MNTTHHSQRQRWWEEREAEKPEDKYKAALGILGTFGMLDIVFVLPIIQPCLTCISIITAKHILHMGKVRKLCKVTSSICFLKRVQLVIYYITTMLGDEKEGIQSESRISLYSVKMLFERVMQIQQSKARTF